jgi:hypothetical protein
VSRTVFAERFTRLLGEAPAFNRAFKREFDLPPARYSESPSHDRHVVSAAFAEVVSSSSRDIGFLVLGLPIKGLVRII